KQMSKLGDLVLWQKSLVPRHEEQFLTALRHEDACYLKVLEQFYEEMIKRSEEKKQIKNNKTGKK
ncbi:D-glycerate dehydrogenase, partial [Staphylococcus aureus]|nr:D-glycerate dehydrogenase [Staphylococcus aureus]